MFTFIPLTLKRYKLKMQLLNFKSSTKTKTQIQNNLTPTNFVYTYCVTNLILLKYIIILDVYLYIHTKSVVCNF